MMAAWGGGREPGRDDPKPAAPLIAFPAKAGIHFAAPETGATVDPGFRRECDEGVVALLWRRAVTSAHFGFRCIFAVSTAKTAARAVGAVGSPCNTRHLF